MSNENLNSGVDLSNPAMMAELAKAQHSTSSSGPKDYAPLHFYNLKEGDNRLMILPPANPSISRLPFKKVFKFRKLPPDNESHLCVELMDPESGHKCPILGVIRDLEASGHDTKNMYPSEANYWQVIDMDGKVEEREIWKDNKKIKVSVDFSVTPQVLRLPPKAHSVVFQFFYIPEVGDFTNPRMCTPIIIKYEAGVIPKYTPSYMTSLKGRVSVPVKIPLFELADGSPDEDKIVDLIGVQVVDAEGTVSYENSKLVNLDAVFRLPLNELQVDTGQIWKSANKLAQYYNRNSNTVIPPNLNNTPAPVSIPAAAPAVIIPPANPAINHMVPAGLTPAPTAPVNPVSVGPVDNASVASTGASIPKGMNTPEGVVSTGAKPKTTFPGAPDCFGTYPTTVASNPEKCNAPCPFAAVCKTTAN